MGKRRAVAWLAVTCALAACSSYASSTGGGDAGGEDAGDAGAEAAETGAPPMQVIGGPFGAPGTLSIEVSLTGPGCIDFDEVVLFQP